MQAKIGKSWLGGAALGAFAAAMAVSGAGVAEGPVKHTADNCQNAYAVLGWMQAPDLALADWCEELDPVCIRKPKLERPSECNPPNWTRKCWADHQAEYVAKIAEHARTCAEWRQKCWVKPRFAPKPDQVWRKIGFMVYGRPGGKGVPGAEGEAQDNLYWHLVPSVQPGAAQQLTFKQYGVEGHGDVTAFVVQCGHGGTCNEFADTFYRWYKHAGIPAVYCGPLPGILTSESTPDIYHPTVEEIESMNSSYRGGGRSGGFDDEPSVDDF